MKAQGNAMVRLVHDLISGSADKYPNAIAVSEKKSAITYERLLILVRHVAVGMIDAGLHKYERVAIYLPKRLEALASMFGTSMAGGVFVPINPLLKPNQVEYILRDCNVRILVTSKDRLGYLRQSLCQCRDLRTVVVIDAGIDGLQGIDLIRVVTWEELTCSSAGRASSKLIDVDMAAILYTSGSTGRPKGVVLSHRNIVAGAESVSEYLGNNTDDRILAALPLSFDYGFSQLTTAFLVGARVALMEYLLPVDIVRWVEREHITGLAGVPSMWVQLADLTWPAEASKKLRYITNSGGAMPRPTLQKLRHIFPKTKVYLMYGLTEAFRSTFLHPDEVDKRPGSIGKAIPNAEIMVVDETGSPCAPAQPGELVHRGSLVALGYWNDRENTVKRFRRISVGRQEGLMVPEVAVWSGDKVYKDEDGYLYFVGRDDEMIKTSGYRVSPTEVEEIVYSLGLVKEAVAVGVPDERLGQAIVLVVTPKQKNNEDGDYLLTECRRQLPNYMVPSAVVWEKGFPRNPNGKIDRAQIKGKILDLMNSNADD
jgi:acyl-CoA ligase (AMP-forming) (exosortase A-associated)